MTSEAIYLRCEICGGAGEIQALRNGGAVCATCRPVTAPRSNKCPCGKTTKHVCLACGSPLCDGHTRWYPGSNVIPDQPTGRVCQGCEATLMSAASRAIPRPAVARG